ncbi:LysR family transcriptional regulator [Paraburkholderia hospita]|jgi:DNA-binding transcriptional LysR family regulator|uniref:LysR family transcriptional regulator n=1 Tax=Paraburkholderia hospita TaxID=169430 RepID=A0ABN0FRS0_9BURK|nr:LysR family transcriptional regulator [Paraburkholderia hospita]SOE57567.1 transcriptional regulator, LysR family [Burkholderia sp. YR290]EIN01447.1 LysR family transcriptional regulator [Paraburkholderia hospita]OUL76078.1 LysR family transcriptional regulator [Paraburkholderia hospita]OUL81435.1 LysR family transcriptional regulator [Paraburkholderia hospita]OUL91765.1 LysR family transcriptional regulator [Paraburkholderia hospita]
MIQRAFDLAQLRTFVAVAEAGSVSAGAERVFLSQSSASEQLKKLEERAGQPLFLRGKQGVTPTPAGAKLLDHARRILAMSEAAFEDLQGRSLDGELRIAITDYYRPHDVARVLKIFSEQHPRLRLHVTVLPSAVIDSSVENDTTFDIGLSLRIVAPDTKRAASNRPHEASTVVRREKLVWAMSADADPRHVATPFHLVLLPSTCQLQRFVVRLLDENKVSYLISHSASGMAGLQLALKAGLGISCLNESSIGSGMVPCPPTIGLPQLPAVEFHLLPGRPGESARVSDAREAFMRLLA